jgi:hypothetical protein
MDRLEQVLAAATPLLRQVDDVLEAAGAPAEHELWAEIRRVRLLPGDAARAVAALTPAAVADAVPELRADARACAETAAALPVPDEWTGEAADAYDDLRRRTAGRLSGAADSLDERLEATADLARSLADWMARTRADLAVTLAAILTSREALTLTTAAPVPPSTEQVPAAADVAARVLRGIANSYDEGADLLRGSAALATPTVS